MTKVKLIPVCAMLPLCLQVGAAVAQEPARARASILEEVIVTAQRREENVQDVGIAVTAMSGDQLREFNFQDAQRITDQTPNFSAGGLGGPSGPPFFVVRGISFVDFSNVNESSVGMYMDDVYLASQGAGAMQLFDLERVEILRGPQGTLFGRNTTAGVAQFVSKQPTEEFEGQGSLQYGQNNQVIGELGFGGPLSDSVRGRIALKYNKDDGWQENKISGKDVAVTDAHALRGILDVDLNEQWMMQLNGHYSKNDGTTPIPLALFGLNPNDLTQYCGGMPVIGGPTDHSHGDCVRSGGGANDLGVVLDNQHTDEGYSEKSDWPMAYEAKGGYVKFFGEMDWATFTSITALEKYEQHFGYDIDAYDYTNAIENGVRIQSDLGTDWRSDAEQFSQEFRLNGEYNGNNWTAGLFYYDAEQSSKSGQLINPALPTGFRAGATQSLIETESFAAFAQLNSPISETVTAVVGLRYTDEARELAELTCQLPSCEPPSAGVPKIETEATTGKAGLEWRPADTQLYYAQYSHGFKSGGFNPNAVISRRGPVEEESVDAFELGMKRYFLDDTLRFNASVFYNKFKGLQALVGSVDTSGNPIVLYINAGDPDIYGVEVELAWSPTDNLEVMFGLGTLDSEISAGPEVTSDGRPLDGKELAQAPDISYNGVIRYHIFLNDAGRVTLQADGRWQDDIFTGVDNDPAEFVDAYGVLNLRTRWASADERYNAEVFVDNVLDETIIQHMFHNTTGGHVTPANAAGVQDGFRTPGRPRLWGLKVGMNF